MFFYHEYLIIQAAVSSVTFLEKKFKISKIRNFESFRRLTLKFSVFVRRLLGWTWGAIAVQVRRSRLACRIRRCYEISLLNKRRNFSYRYSNNIFYTENMISNMLIWKWYNFTERGYDSKPKLVIFVQFTISVFLTGSKQFIFA